MDINKVVLAIMAVGGTLLATIGDAPIPADYKAGIAWVLGGLVAGLASYLGLSASGSKAPPKE